jgi:hypothetical protein
MLENLPAYISPIFILTTFATIGFLLFAVRQTRPSKTFFISLAATLIVLLVVHAILSLNGFYLVNTTPPRFPLGPVPTILILLVLFFNFGRNLETKSFLQILTLLHIVRVPVELVLLWLYQNGLVPELMTFEGRNFDILSGLTAPFVAWLGFRHGKINKPLLIGWNLAALGLLFNIVTTAILSLQTPFQQFAFDQPNRGVLYFPFIWLPSIIVPIVFVSHVLSLWQLLKRRTAS